MRALLLRSLLLGLLTGAPAALAQSATVEEVPPAAAAPAVPAAAPAASPALPAEPGPVLFRGALEVGVQPLPAGTPGGDMDALAVVQPLLSFDGGADFGFELGAALRARLYDALPLERERDFGGWLRREDWDEQSDFGQLLRSLRLGAEDSHFALRAGPLLSETLGHGSLVVRYTNRLQSDYHPAGATLRFHAGPVRTEVLASDVLAWRLFAADVRADLAQVLGAAQALHGRYHASLSAAHDAGRAGGRSAELTLLNLDADAVLYRGPQLQAVAFGSLGSRLNLGAPQLGGQLGVELEAQLQAVVLGGRLAARRVGGGYRVGMFGPAYELARFAGTGLGGVPLAEERLPQAWSGYALVQLGMGPQEEAAIREEALAPRAGLSAAVEVFDFGRVDADGLLQLDWPAAGATAGARVMATGLGLSPRLYAGLEGRLRLASSLYALGGGGTVFFPQPDGRLLRGVTVSLGVGVDFER